MKTIIKAKSRIQYAVSVALFVLGCRLMFIDSYENCLTFLTLEAVSLLLLVSARIDECVSDDLELLQPDESLTA